MPHNVKQGWGQGQTQCQVKGNSDINIRNALEKNLTKQIIAI